LRWRLGFRSLCFYDGKTKTSPILFFPTFLSLGQKYCQAGRFTSPAFLPLQHFWAAAMGPSLEAVLLNCFKCAEQLRRAGLLSACPVFVLHWLRRNPVATGFTRRFRLPPPPPPPPPPPGQHSACGIDWVSAPSLCAVAHGRFCGVPQSTSFSLLRLPGRYSFSAGCTRGFLGVRRRVWRGIGCWDSIRPVSLLSAAGRQLGKNDLLRRWCCDRGRLDCWLAGKKASGGGRRLLLYTLGAGRSPPADQP